MGWKVGGDLNTAHRFLSLWRSTGRLARALNKCLGRRSQIRDIIKLTLESGQDFKKNLMFIF